MRPGTPAPPPRGADSRAVRACLFRLGGDRFAVDVGYTRGVFVVEDATRVPGTPAYVVGLANLRGRLVPLLDARERLGLPAIARAGAKALVIHDDTVEVGFVIEDVLGLESLSNARPPRLGERLRFGDLAEAILLGPEGPVVLLSVPRLIHELRIDDWRMRAARREG